MKNLSTKLISFALVLMTSGSLWGQNLDKTFEIYSVYDYFEGDSLDQTKAVDIQGFFKIYGSYSKFSITRDGETMNIKSPKYVTTKKVNEKVRAMIFEYESTDGTVTFSLNYIADKLAIVNFFIPKTRKHQTFYLFQ